MFIRLVLILFFGILAWPFDANAWQSGSDDINVWQEPNAWEIHTPSRPSCPVCEVHKPQEDNCPVCEMHTPSGTDCPLRTDCPLCPVCETSKENGVATIYYKKMIGQLFDRSILKANTATGKLERSVVFSLTNAQLKIIENSSDVENLNAVVIAILKATKKPELPTEDSSESPSKILEFCNGFFSYLLQSLKSIWKYVCQIPKTFLTFYSYSSEIRFAMFVCLITLSIWFIHKRYNKNLIILVIISFVGFGYFCTYIECNRKLQAEELIEFIQQNEPDEKKYFGKAFFDFFKPSAKEQKIKQIKNNAKVKLQFCRPDHVAIQYCNDIFFDQLQLVVVKLSDSMGILQDKIPFPFNYLGMIALPFLFMSFLPLLFRYVFNPAIWFQALRSPSSNQHPNQHSNRNMNDGITQGDRLSGDNLKILFEVLKCKSETEKPATSGVEIVKDLPEANNAKIEDKKCAIEGIRKRTEAIGNNNSLDEEKSKNENNTLEEENSKKES